jgi:hypothetical protein
MRLRIHMLILIVVVVVTITRVIRALILIATLIVIVIVTARADRCNRNARHANQFALGGACLGPLSLHARLHQFVDRPRLLGSACIL